MRLYPNGEPRIIVVDDRFPYDTHRERWAFSRCDKTPEIWVLLLEKAFAKLYGSYQRIQGGAPSDALSQLTGCPTTQHIIETKVNKDQWWS